jgi:LmbE family N-acetylglucosaminyl deacetylase
MGTLRRTAYRALRKLARRLAPAEVTQALDFLSQPANPIFPRRPLVVARSVSRARVLVLAPHPDDEAIGMGGTLAMHAANGSSVCVVYLTDGGGVGGGGVGGERERLIAVRRAEAEAVGRDLGVRQVFWANRDTELTNDARTVAALSELLRELAPEIVYAPSIFDTHFDHFATNGVLAGALAATPAVDATVAGYEVWDTIPFANWVVDVSEVQARKDALLAHYVTPHETTDFTGLCRRRASVHYTLHVNSVRAAAERGYAEAFLRFDREGWRELFAGWVRVLRARGHDLPSHLVP